MLPVSAAVSPPSMARPGSAVRWRSWCVFVVCLITAAVLAATLSVPDAAASSSSDVSAIDHTAASVTAGADEVLHDFLVAESRYKGALTAATRLCAHATSAPQQQICAAADKVVNNDTVLITELSNDTTAVGRLAQEARRYASQASTKLSLKTLASLAEDGGAAAAADKTLRTGGSGGRPGREG